MRMGIVGACAIAAVLALSGCKKPEEPASAPEAEAAGGSAVSAETAATIAEMPKRKPGLWTEMVAMEGGKTSSQRVCLDEATAAKLPVKGQSAAGSTCSEDKVTKDGQGYTFTSTCKAAQGATVTMTGKATGDFSSAYNVSLTSQVTGAPKPELNRTSQVTIAARWAGPCPADWLPGDIELPGGTRVNYVATLESMNAAAAGK